jgi:hypothetical protein
MWYIPQARQDIGKALITALGIDVETGDGAARPQVQ